eukprot:3506824-Pyramimonas_sp.AAC.1
MAELTTVLQTPSDNGFTYKHNKKGQLILNTDKGYYHPGEVVTGMVLMKVHEAGFCRFTCASALSRCNSYSFTYFANSLNLECRKHKAENMCES